MNATEIEALECLKWIARRMGLPDAPNWELTEDMVGLIKTAFEDHQSVLRTLQRVDAPEVDGDGDILSPCQRVEALARLQQPPWFGSVEEHVEPLEAWQGDPVEVGHQVLGWSSRFLSEWLGRLKLDGRQRTRLMGRGQFMWISEGLVYLFGDCLRNLLVAERAMETAISDQAEYWADFPGYGWQLVLLKAKNMYGPSDLLSPFVEAAHWHAEAWLTPHNVMLVMRSLWWPKGVYRIAVSGSAGRPQAGVRSLAADLGFQSCDVDVIVDGDDRSYFELKRKSRLASESFWSGCH